MSNIIPLRLIDRTRTVADWKCPRARFWGYEYNGRGIVKASTGLELFLGIAVHDALAVLAHSTLNDLPISIDEIAKATHDQVYEELYPKDQVILGDAITFAEEQATLVEGLIRGFYRQVWPKLMDQYTIVTCEQEMEYPLDPPTDCPSCKRQMPETLVCSECGGTGTVGKSQYVFMTKPDLILEDKQTGDLVYVEYKTTSSKKDKWIESWDTAVQLHSSVKATERSLGKTVSHVQIIGLYKGYESYGKQSSPFCYAYKRSGNPPFTQDQISYEYKAGFKRFAVWELPSGVKGWVESMPEDILASQFPLTAPIFVNDDLINSFFKQRLEREKEIASFNGNEDLDRIFPQRFDQCKPSFGYSCGYTKLCHGHVGDPLEEGFVLREPHHDLEREQLGLDQLDNG